MSTARCARSDTKVKHASEDIDRKIVQETRANDWSLDTSTNPYDSNTVFYRHVSSAAEMEETADTLVQHFGTFGDEYAARFRRVADRTSGIKLRMGG